MRELTFEELELVAGGNNGDSEEERNWWNDAFDDLSDGLGALGDLFPGWVGDYLDMWGDGVGAFENTGDLINDEVQGYDQYLHEAEFSEPYDGGDGPDNP